jgi:hypothetical protein
MFKIYKKASSTLIWLGEETSDVKGWARAAYAYRRHFPAESFTENTTSLKQERDIFRRQQSKRVLLGLDNVFTTIHGTALCNIHMRPWWSRKWIVQEVVMSRNPILVCGDVKVPWSVWDDNISYMHRY